MRNRPTLSFFILVAIAAVATYGALLMSSQMLPADSYSDIAPENNITPVKPETTGTLAEILDDNQSVPVALPKSALVDTTEWEEFTDPSHYLSFKHPSDWTVRTYPDREGYYIIAIRPDEGSDNIRVYIGPQGYFATDGLSYQFDTISGVRARNINNMIYGVKYAAQYYTFSLGNDLELLPEFNTIIKTVALSR